MGKSTRHMSGKIKIPPLPEVILMLWHQSYFKTERTFGEISTHLSGIGCNPGKANLSHALGRAPYITINGKRGNYRYIQKSAPISIVHQSSFLPDELCLKLEKDFKEELNDLRLNFGRSGTCTAFLLRKILEKMIFKVFCKNQQEKELYDKDGNVLGLDALINKAKTCTVGGVPFLMPKTAAKIAGIKILGDNSAHNPMINVPTKLIYPEMVNIITAYLELSTKL
jgi:hypothetical protein